MIRVLKDMTCEGGLAEDSMILLSCCDQYSVITHSVRTKVYLNHPTDRNTQNQIRLKSIHLVMALPRKC